MSVDPRALLQAKLDRYRAQLTTQAPPNAAPTDRGVVANAEAAEPVLTMDQRFPWSHRHGRYTLGQLNDTLAEWQAKVPDHPLASHNRRVSDLLFFDTETTGLSHGAGTLIFLLGYARFEADAVVVRQQFLTSPSAEALLYERFFGDMSTIRQLVTYNGKAFDWPQVRTRHTMLRHDLPALPVCDHLDLVHPARRLWSSELDSCRLAVIEQQKLEVIRTDDTPGHLAPLLYFDYLHTGQREALQGIFRHNQWDVLSLITLYIHLSTMILNHSGNVHLSEAERFAVSRWYESLGHDALAADGYAAIVEGDQRLSLQARVALGRCRKRQGDWQGALQVWEACLPQLATSEPLLVELSKLCEHQLRDYEKALYYAEHALTAGQTMERALRRPIDTANARHDRRLERLRGKLERSLH